jgi:hypothetical protein
MEIPGQISAEIDNYTFSTLRPAHLRSFGTMAETPPNIDEFNQIAALVFAQLYREFPVVVDIDKRAIAKALGVSETSWDNYMLPSSADKPASR